MLLASGALYGCSNEESDPHSKQGFASDTEIKDYDLTVKFLVDSNLKNSNTDDGIGRVEAILLDYQAITGRGNVTFQLKYLDSASLKQGASDGFSQECDGVIALSGTVDLGLESGVLYGGTGGASARDLSKPFSESVAVVAASGSGTQMPAASTVDGEDAPDGSFTKLMNLPEFDGKIAIGKDSLTEGFLANKVLARIDYYSQSDGVGGEYVDSLKDKVVIYESTDELAQAVRSGECGLGFMLRSSLWGAQSGLSVVYEPDYGNAYYKGASLANASEGGVARDFLEYASTIV